MNKDDFMLIVFRLIGKRREILTSATVATGTGYTGDSVIVNNDYAALTVLTATSLVENQEVGCSISLGWRYSSHDRRAMNRAICYAMFAALTDVNCPSRITIVSAGCADKDSCKQAVDVS